VTDLVRVKHATTKAEYTVHRDAVEADRQLSIIDKPATYTHGQLAGLPLPPKPHTEVPAAKNTTTKTTSKES